MCCNILLIHAVLSWVDSWDKAIVWMVGMPSSTLLAMHQHAQAGQGFIIREHQTNIVLLCGRCSHVFFQSTCLDLFTLGQSASMQTRPPFVAGIWCSLTRAPSAGPVNYAGKRPSLTPPSLDSSM
mmetsp:Transcript_8309/g.51776  ORF Transcript_8309/g.51776 Transcript_8309/m.51776 type:complete len:125 (+) Transcript_8309:747-1121(+)